MYEVAGEVMAVSAWLDPALLGSEAPLPELLVRSVALSTGDNNRCDRPLSPSSTPEPLSDVRARHPVARARRGICGGGVRTVPAAAAGAIFIFVPCPASGFSAASSP